MGAVYKSSFDNYSLNHKGLRFADSNEEIISVDSKKGILVITTDGKLIFANNYFYNIAGLSSAKISSEDTFLKYFQDSSTNNRLFLSLLKKEISNYVIEKKILLEDGKELLLRIDVSLISNLNNSPNLILGIIREMSEKVFTVINEIPPAHLDIKSEEIKKDDSLFELGKTISFITHQFKSALTSIKMNMDMFVSSKKLSDEDSYSFGIMSKEINRLNKMIKEILQFSKQSETLFVKLDLFQTINHIEELFRPLLKTKNIQFKNLTKDIYLKGDLFNIQSLFMHLIENSIEAVPKNGIIEVSGSIDLENKVALILVKDNGKGVQQKEKIFEPFHTTKSTGTGLGLSIAKKIVKQHDGFITLISSKSWETIFQLILPLWNE
ncbi:MAG: two-component system sensor histidine kinase NtrB [Syntrophothermus sp.]